MIMKVTVCQLDNRAGSRDAALAELAHHAAAEQTDLVLLPELPFSDWLAADGAPDTQAWLDSVTEHDASIAQLSELGARGVVATRPTVEAGGNRHNQAFIWTPRNGAARIRDKYYLPNESGYWEAQWYDRGELTFGTGRVADAKIGVAICTEMWFFDLARHYARSKVDVLCVPRASPLETSTKWLSGGQAAAVCSGAYCLSSNQWAPSGSGLEPGGPGWVTDPEGVVLATTSAAAPFVTVEIDLDVAREAKSSYPRYVRE